MRKVILYKIGRFQKDFEYLFPEVKVVKYIVDEKIRRYNDKPCINIKNIVDNFKYMIVICDRKNNETNTIFNNLSFKENKDYIYFEDYAQKLDQPLTRKERKQIDFYKEKSQIGFISNIVSNSELVKKMIYTDVRSNIYCQDAFRHAQILPNGNVYPCCPGRAEESIGNIFLNKPNKVWNSKRAAIFRLSIINKTYAFCNLDYCEIAPSEIQKENERFENLKPSVKPEITVVSFDFSCNLKCKSCRNCLINNNKSKEHLYFTNVIANKLLKYNWLAGADQLVMAAQGEVFFSKVYLKMLFSKKLKGLKQLIIHTNGTLLSPKMLDKLCSKFNAYGTNIVINVSVDSIIKETYEKLRIGGNMDILKRNLEYLAKARSEWRVSHMTILCVLQKDNYQELPQLIQYAIDLHFDRIEISRIANWHTYTDNEFAEISMYDKDGNPKPELLKVLENPIFKTTKIKILGNVIRN